MVALATIFTQLVAKATSFPESAGQSILARDGKCANFPEKNYCRLILEIFSGMTEGAWDCARRTGGGLSPPLGMVESAEFPVMHFQLAPGDTLMLLSDGVAEAQDAHGHLFGFERIEAMLRQPITAAEVATAAQEFGQQDDISVMRVVRAAKAAERTSVEPALAVG
jgi:hypothetical protein